MPKEATDNAKLSRLLFESREAAEMYADIVKAQYGREAENLRRLVKEIDDYRTGRGWNRHGYGGEK